MAQQGRRAIIAASLMAPFALASRGAAQVAAPVAGCQRQPITIHVADTARFKETYGLSEGQTIRLDGELLAPIGTRAQTVFLMMHPTGLSQTLPLPHALADAGLHVLCCTSRYPLNDSALIMEKVALDMGAWVGWARQQGYEKVVLIGWSGGGSLSLFYQAQAKKPSITHTPAGDEVDLTRAGLSRADGVIFIAAHLSRSEVLTEWLDPSVRDEADPEARLREFDIYSADCPNKPPFSPDFVAAFRQAQRERSRRITAYAQEWLATLKARGGPEMERAFVVHRTMCDVRWIDTSVDHNDRRPNWSYQGDPRTVNVGLTGLARFTSLRSWLSQWSYDLSQTRATVSAARISAIPVLQVENGADDAVPASHIPTVRAALATPDREFVRIEGANHYYVGQPDLAKHCTAIVKDWATRKGFVAA